VADLCGQIRIVLVLATFAMAGIHTGAAYNGWLSTTDASSLLFHWSEPPILGMSLDSVNYLNKGIGKINSLFV